MQHMVSAVLLGAPTFEIALGSGSVGGTMPIAAWSVKTCRPRKPRPLRMWEVFVGSREGRVPCTVKAADADALSRLPAKEFKIDPKRPFAVRRGFGGSMQVFLA